jgi:hypothetical protein
VGDLKISDPSREFFWLPPRGEMFKTAARSKRANDNAEATNVMQRQREAPAGACRDIKVGIHRVRRNAQRMFTQRNPFRFAAAAGCFEKHVRAELGKIRN